MRMELAAALHHSSFRGAGPETYDAPRRQRTANSRVDSVLFDLFEEDTEGARPDRIATLSGPHARVQRRTVQQIVDAVSLVPLLDDPVPQMVEQLPDVLRFFDRFATVPEQVIAVPKIYIEERPYARGSACYAAGRTAGGSADDHLLSYDCVVSRDYGAADCGAER